MPSSASDSSPSHDMGRGAEAAVDPLAPAVVRMFTMWFSSVSDSSSSSSDCSIFGTVMRTAPVVDGVVADAVVVVTSNADGWVE